MKVKYVGPVKEVYVPRLGKFIRGGVYDFPDEVALTLLKNTGFRLVEPPKRVRRPRRRVRAPRPPKPKEETVEEKPKTWVKPKFSTVPKKAEESKEDPPREEEEIKIEKKTPKEV